MDIKQLKRFLEICNTKSFVAAANKIYISQQALSNSIKLLENELGKKLFYRTSKGVFLTEEGRFLKKICTPLVKDFDKMVLELSGEFQSKKEKLVIGLVPGVLWATFPDLLIRFRENHPNIDLKVIEGFDVECVNKVIKGTVDIAVCPRPFEKDVIGYFTLRKEKVYAIVNKKDELAGRKTLSMRDLFNKNIVTLNKYHQLYHRILAVCKHYNFIPKFVVESGESNVLLGLVKTDNYIFICMEHIAMQADTESCSRILITDEEMTWEYGLVFKKDKTLSKGAKKLIEFFHDKIL